MGIENMEKLFLEKPTIHRKNDALDYAKENVESNSDLNGAAGLERCLDEISYEEWLVEIERREDIEYATRINRCPSKTFFVAREDDNRIVGMVNVRYSIREELLNTWASHIGYGIRPSERRKGYAKIALYLSLLVEKKLGEEKVSLNCIVDNVASNKTIIALGGVLEKTAFDEYDETMTNHYRIDVTDSFEKYRGNYESHIKRDEEILKGPKK